MRKYLLVLVAFSMQYGLGQSVSQKLSLAIKQLESDLQLKHALIGFSVVDSKTGKVVYEHNAQVGLAAASTQKLLTSCAAFELLGKDFRYTTEIGYNKVMTDPGQGYFILKPSGDPTFGSSRFTNTNPDFLLGKVVAAIKLKGIKEVVPLFIINDSSFEKNGIPRGWIWEDIGNYYGASAQSFNWLENQFDIVLKSGSKVGDRVTVKAILPSAVNIVFNEQVTSAAKGSGDNTIVYIGYDHHQPLIEGTIPVNEDSFNVSASIADPLNIFSLQLNKKMKEKGVALFDGHTGQVAAQALDPFQQFNYVELYRHTSPSLDSINYWFLKKSINLYGEALTKTIAFRKSGFGSTDKGIELIKKFWEEKGLEESAINVIDGSGLSPQNRVTADALVKVLQFAKSRSWFNSFFYALPEFNGIKMKSGSITGARAYAGYLTSKTGSGYSFAIIINNYNGEAGTIVKKMYKLLDILK